LVKISFHDSGSTDDKLSYFSNWDIFILIVHNTCLKARDGEANGSRPGFATERVFHTHRRALGKPVSFVDGGMEPVLGSAKHFHWKRGAP
jgi:hypothetical protein